MGLLQCLNLNSFCLAILLLFILVVDSSDVNPKIERNLKVNSNNTSNELKSEVNSSSDPVGVAHLKKEVQIGRSNEIVDKDIVRNNTTLPSEFKEDENREITEKSLVLKDNKENGDGVGSGENFTSISKDGVGETSIEKEKLWDAECDPSNMCFDEMKNWTACLRVPGNDSPDLSLLIQNKGKRPVIVTIAAPPYVQLEETKVQLQEKEDKKVKVSIAYEGKDSLIFLTTEDSQCSLDFRELIAHNSRVETRYAFNLRYLNFFSRTHLIILLALTTSLFFGCGCVYFGLHKKLFLGNGYEVLDMELPVSSVVKAGLEANDGWDDSWDDRWDDEEAPKTPVMPATPNLSSRGLASRRLSKEGWKD